MAFRTNKCIFYHIPKTGGMWVREALEQSVPSFSRVKEYQSRHKYGLVRGHKTPKMVLSGDINNKKLYSFTFVRHPYSWYKSYWAYRIVYGSDLQIPGKIVDFPLEPLWCEDFEKFTKAVLRAYPDGILSKIYQCYVGKDGLALDFIGKQENLVDDLILALTLAEEDFDADKIKNTNKVNLSGSMQRFSDVKLTEKTKRRLMETESWILKTFYE